MQSEMFSYENRDVVANLDIHGYNVVKSIGKGGFAECFLVFSRKYAMYFACKVISLNSFHQNDRKESFETELDTLVHVMHPNIIQVYDKFMSDTHLFLILEYCSNGDVAEYIKHNGPIKDQTKLLRFISMMLNSLEYLETINIAHNDVKPSNFLIDQHGRIKLTDFGIAKKIKEEGELCKDFRGSLFYLAPEVVSFRSYNPLKAQIWSFGATVYFLAAGHCPFRGSDMSSIIRLIQLHNCKYPKYLTPFIKELIQKCLNPNPMERPTFSELKKLVNQEMNNDSLQFCSTPIPIRKTGSSLIKPHVIKPLYLSKSSFRMTGSLP